MTAETAARQPLTIKNQCSDGVWAVLTPGGNPDQVAALANSGGWFRPYATQENFIPLGVTGSIAKGGKTLTLAKKPASPLFFKAGQIVEVAGAGTAGPLVATIDKVQNEGLVLLLDKAAKTTVLSAEVEYDTLQGAVLIPANQSMRFTVPDAGAPGSNFRFFIGCPSLADNTRPFGGSCVIGAAAGDLSGINTLFEPTFGCVKGTADCAFNPADPAPACQSNPNAKNCAALSPTDYFDISAVDGYTLPIKVEATGTSCSAPLKDASMLDLGSCPTEDASTLFSTEVKQQTLIEQSVSLLTRDVQGNYQACVAPYKWFQLSSVGSPKDSRPTAPDCPAGSGKCTSVSYYAGAGCDPKNPRLACPGGSGPQQRVGPRENGKFAIQNTGWVRQLYALGYTGYTWQYGDGVGSQSCDAGAAITVTLCPGNPKPYLKAAWEFDAATGQCRIGGQGANRYDSLAACQEANMRYVCDDLTASDPYKIPGALWRADAAATLKGQGYTYNRFRKLAQLKCAPVPVNGIAGISSVPVCTYYYAGAELCPANAVPQ